MSRRVGVLKRRRRLIAVLPCCGNEWGKYQFKAPIEVHFFIIFLKFSEADLFISFDVRLCRTEGANP
jgi:hypothetical protein